MKLLFWAYVTLAVMAVSVVMYRVTTGRSWLFTALYLALSVYWIIRCFQTRKTLKSIGRCS